MPIGPRRFCKSSNRSWPAPFDDGSGLGKTANVTLDPLLLSRLQFFWVVALHILLPAFTVGLSCYIALLEWRFFRTGNALYFRISAFWLRIFAISFGLGVVSTPAQRSRLLRRLARKALLIAARAASAVLVERAQRAGRFFRGADRGAEIHQRLRAIAGTRRP